MTINIKHGLHLTRAKQDKCSNVTCATGTAARKFGVTASYIHLFHIAMQLIKTETFVAVMLCI